VPEILVFSRPTWDTLSTDDQALIRRLAREAQLDERQLWNKVEDEAMAKRPESRSTQSRTRRPSRPR